MSSVEVQIDGSASTALCTQCGLCCTGALHDFAVLEPGEIDDARAIGLTIRTEGRPGFALPCPKLSSSCCSIYGERPKVCGRYQCALLERVIAGSIDLEAAALLVAEARKLTGSVVEHLPPGMTIPAARDLNEAREASSVAADPPFEMRLRLAITALSLFLDQHFRKSSEGPLLSLESIADDRPDAEMR